MKVYITAPIYYREKLLPVLKACIRFLKQNGHKVFSEDIVKTSIDEALSPSQEIQTSWFETWRKYISRCDFCVAEISYPGTINVGFEIAAILSRGKPVIGLYKKGADPIFLNELHSNRLIKISYDNENSVINDLSWAVSEVKHILSRRFTFFIPPEIDQFLEKLYQEEGLSRSEFIRNLIEKEMKKRKTNSK